MLVQRPLSYQGEALVRNLIVQCVCSLNSVLILEKLRKQHPAMGSFMQSDLQAMLPRPTYAHPPTLKVKARDLCSRAHSYIAVWRARTAQPNFLPTEHHFPRPEMPSLRKIILVIWPFNRELFFRPILRRMRLVQRHLGAPFTFQSGSLVWAVHQYTNTAPSSHLPLIAALLRAIPLWRLFPSAAMTMSVTK